jgi:hypothetical protein
MINTTLYIDAVIKRRLYINMIEAIYINIYIYCSLFCVGSKYFWTIHKSYHKHEVGWNIISTIINHNEFLFWCEAYVIRRTTFVRFKVDFVLSFVKCKLTMTQTGRGGLLDLAVLRKSYIFNFNHWIYKCILAIRPRSLLFVCWESIVSHWIYEPKNSRQRNIFCTTVVVLN